MLSALVFLSWGASFLAAEPIPAPAIRLTIALPAQSVDFGDLDYRDENNQPIAAPTVRRRFEDVFNSNLNRLLIENLTPLRRAWLDMLSREKDAFADWIGRAVSNAQRLFWIAVNGGTRIAVVIRSAAMTAAGGRTAGFEPAGERFVSLIFLLIASTRLIC
jgi:hypothetical protein